MFFFSDLPGTTLAAFIFAFLLLTPGYVAGFLFDVFGFRGLDLNWRVVMSVPLSAAIVPLVVYLLLAWSVVPAMVVFGLVQVLWLSLILGHFGHERPGEWLPRLKNIPLAAAGIVLAWYIVTALSLADLQIGQRLYYSLVAIDHSFRTAVTEAITRTGIPPVSPFNHLDGDVPLRYYIFWFALCSFVQQLSGGMVNARDAMNGSVVWCGFGLMALVPLFLRVFEGLEGAVLRRRAFVGVALLSVTGLDLIPNLVLLLRHHSTPADMEWWTPDFIASWVDAALWVPHHVGALVAGLTGFVLVWYAAVDCTTRQRKLLHATLAGVAFASAAGCSVYIGLALALAIASWIVYTLARGWREHSEALIFAGAAGVLFGLPDLLRLRLAHAGGRLFAVGLWYGWESDHVIRFFGVRPGIMTLAVQLPFVAFTYAIEFGFFFFAAVVKIRQMRLSRRLRPQDAATLVIGGATLLVCTFIRSVTNLTNDFGWRGFMLLQFVLLLWAASVLDLPRTGWRPVAYLLLLTGCAGTIYQVGMLRFYNVAVDYGIFYPADTAGAGGRLTYSLRALYSQLDRLLPRSAIVQANPESFCDFCWGLYANRQTAAARFDCFSYAGGSLDSCRADIPLIRAFFNDATLDPEQAKALARRFKIDAVVVADTDPVWGNPDSWIHRQHPAIDLPHARAFLFTP